MWHGGLAVAGQVPRGVPRGFATILVVDRTPVGTPSTPFVGSAVVPRLAIMYWFDPDWAMTSARPVLSLLHVGLLSTSVMFLKPGSPTIRLNDEATTRVVSATTSKTSPPTPWFHITVEPQASPGWRTARERGCHRQAIDRSPPSVYSSRRKGPDSCGRGCLGRL